MKLQPYELRAIQLALKSLQLISKRLNRLDCANCNGEIDEKLYFKKVDRLNEKAQKISKEVFNMNVYHQSDPRGASLYLLPKDMKANENGYIEYTNGYCV